MLPASPARPARRSMLSGPIPVHRKRYDDFVAGMVYGEKSDFEAAIGSVVVLAENAMLQGENGAR